METAATARFCVRQCASEARAPLTGSGSAWRAARARLRHTHCAETSAPASARASHCASSGRERVRRAKPRRRRGTAAHATCPYHELGRRVRRGSGAQFNAPRSYRIQECVHSARGPEGTRARIVEGRLQSRLRSAMDSQAMSEGGEQRSVTACTRRATASVQE